MQILNSAGELQKFLALTREGQNTIAFVPTMGALHNGHLSLVEIARERADVVVVSIFVNPLQFGAGEDFDKYPRTLQADAELLEANGVDILFAPSVTDVYPNGQEVLEHAGPVGEILEGASRPGHFDGMLTVVARLFDIVKPDFAVFGAKDAQQLFLIKQMVANERGLPAHRWNQLQVIEGETIREQDGLARSSRNRYLSQEEHRAALAISAGLRAASGISGGASTRIREVRQALEAEPLVRLDYVALVDPGSFEPIDDSFSGRALLLIAARVGSTRLIDNLSITI
ncbi:MAG: pantoate--beta-alanine ligase [Micrococcales bacterium]